MIKDLGKKKKKGFSLVELIVVIAIIGILAAIAVPKYSQYQQAAKIRADKSTAKMIADATLMAHQTDGLAISSVTYTSTAATKKVPNDAWDNIKRYISGEAATKSVSNGIWNIDCTTANKIKVLLGGKEMATLEY